MVQASTLILAAFAVAPVLSAPLTVTQPESYDRRSIDNVDALDVRDPFSFGKLVKGVGRVVKKAAPIAASLLLRDVDGNLVERNIEIDDLDLRDPKFSFGKLVKGVAGVVKKAAPIAAKLLLRDVEGNVYVRDIDIDNLNEFDARDYYDIDDSLLERDFFEVEELDARDPKFRLGNIFKKVTSIAGKAAGIAGKVANVAGAIAGREFEDMDEFEAREYYDIEDSLFERELLEALAELEARDPKFRLGNILKKVSGIAGKVGGIAGKVVNVAGALSGREFEDEMEVRSIDELD